MQKNLHKNRRISECIIDTDLKFWNIRFKTWISISYQIIFFHIMHSFWVISSSKAFRSGRAGSGRAGPGHIKNGFFEWKWVFFVFTLICTLNIDRAMKLRKIRYMPPEKSATLPRFARFRPQAQISYNLKWLAAIVQNYKILITGQEKPHHVRYAN